MSSTIEKMFTCWISIRLGTTVDKLFLWIQCVGGIILTSRAWVIVTTKAHYLVPSIQVFNWSIQDPLELSWQNSSGLIWNFAKNDTLPLFTKHRAAGRPPNIPIMYNLVLWNRFLIKNEQKLNKNKQELTLFQAPKSGFHYLFFVLIWTSHSEKSSYLIIYRQSPIFSLVTKNTF